MLLHGRLLLLPQPRHLGVALLLLQHGTLFVLEVTRNYEPMVQQQLQLPTVQDKIILPRC